jgi:hypothetical protein
MSDSPDPNSPKPRRSSDRRRAGGTARKSAGRRPPSGRRKPKIPAFIQVADDAGDKQQSSVELLKKEAKTGIPGVAVSTAIHAVILLVMALFVVRIDVDTEGPLSFGWDYEVEKKEEVTPTVMAPVKIQSVQLNQRPTPKVVEKTEPKVETKPKIGRPIQPADVAKSLALRTPKRTMGKDGGTGSKNSVEQAIKSGLEWLKRQQKTGGNWQLHTGYPDAGYSVLRTDTGATALALLAFLGDGHTQNDGDYQETVRKGLKWLRGIQKPDGDYHDHTELGRQTAFYAHSQATIAICEAYALTGDTELAASAELAIQFLLNSQHPLEGGWRYQPQEKDSMGDLSVTGWGLMALNTARMAGIEVPPEAFGRVSFFLDQVATRDGALYRYLPSDPTGKASRAMTACGLLGRQWLGWSRDDPAMVEGVDWLLRPEFAPQWSDGKRNVYEWYYVAQTLHNLGGERYKLWFGNVQNLIVDSQKRRGSRKAPDDVAGSWSPVEPSGSLDEYANKAGRLYMTAMCLLVLETPVRHAPIYPEPATPPEL